MTDIPALIARVRELGERSCEDPVRIITCLTAAPALATALEAALAENERLREALKPFAECGLATAERVAGDPMDLMSDLTFGHFREARAALEGTK